MKEENDEPLIVLKYHKGKMLGRFVCFWGPMISLCAFMMNTAIQQSKWMMFIIFLLFFVGSIFYWLVLLNAKEFVLYKDKIIKRRTFSKDIQYELKDAGYSNYTIWFREMIVITSQNQKKSLAIFYGFIARNNMKLFYEILSQLTGMSPEKLDCGCNLRLGIKNISKEEEV